MASFIILTYSYLVFYLGDFIFIYMIDNSLTSPLVSVILPLNLMESEPLGVPSI